MIAVVVVLFRQYGHLFAAVVIAADAAAALMAPSVSEERFPSSFLKLFSEFRIQFTLEDRS